MARLEPKKILLSGLVLISFVAYSFGARHSGNDNRSTITPKTSPTTMAPSAQTAITYKDGEYTGSVADAFYGNIQVQTTIQGGKIVGVDFLQYPNDQPNSVAINKQAMPFLQQEAIKVQNAHVDSVSGATDTSQAFVESLSAALNKAM
ncbi:MAG TPA: FMN-binding protein [Candidatus Saccharimonadales bacterium]|nr:FMN-binding protein [Candidatus Saccharimonadales bacterium]